MVSSAKAAAPEGNQSPTKWSASISIPSKSKVSVSSTWICSASLHCHKQFTSIAEWRAHENASCLCWACPLENCMRPGTTFASLSSLRQHLRDVDNLSHTQALQMTQGTEGRLRADTHARLLSICPVHLCSQGPFQTLCDRQDHIKDRHRAAIQRNWAGDSDSEFWENLGYALWNMMGADLIEARHRNTTTSSSASSGSNSSGRLMTMEAPHQSGSDYRDDDVGSSRPQETPFSSKDLGQAWVVEHYYKYQTASSIPQAAIKMLKHHRRIDTVSAYRILLAQRIGDDLIKIKSARERDGLNLSSANKAAYRDQLQSEFDGSPGKDFCESNRILASLSGRLADLNLGSTEPNESISLDAAKTAIEAHPRIHVTPNPSSPPSMSSDTHSEPSQTSSHTDGGQDAFSGGSPPWSYYLKPSEFVSSSHLDAIDESKSCEPKVKTSTIWLRSKL